MIHFTPKLHPFATPEPLSAFKLHPFRKAAAAETRVKSPDCPGAPSEARHNYNYSLWAPEGEFTSLN